MRHWTQENLWVTDPPVIFTFQVPVLREDYRGAYSVLRDDCEERLELWYHINYPGWLQDPYNEPQVKLYIHGVCIGRWTYIDYNFIWQKYDHSRAVYKELRSY